jgi:hypothetical protein
LHVERHRPGEGASRRRIGDGELDRFDEAQVFRLGEDIDLVGDRFLGSPTLSRLQAGSTLVTTPETSVPGAKGKGGRRWYLPAITRVVAKLTPAA